MAGVGGGERSMMEADRGVAVGWAVEELDVEG